MTWLAALGLAAQMAVANPSAPAPELRGEALMTALRSGGYTLLVRHARTDRSIPTRETPGYSPPLRSEQRNLTAAGERDVKLMAAVVKRYALPIGEVLSSPIYRCRETADAFGTPTVTLALRVFPTTAETAALVRASAAPGTNRVLVTHHFVIEALVPGIRPGDIGESEVAVVRPAADGGVELVGRITLADWEQLAGAASADTPPAPAAHGDAAPEAAHDAAAAAAFHASPAGRLAAGYIGVFNSGDAERMRAFIESSLELAEGRSTEDRVASYRRLFAEHGPLAVHGIDSVTDDAAAVRIRSRRGDFVLRVIAASAESGRAASVSFLMYDQAGHR